MLLCCSNFTGLPVHVNARFLLMSQRRALEDAKLPKWNSALCTDIIAPLYVLALARVAASHGTSHALLDPFKSDE